MPYFQKVNLKRAFFENLEITFGYSLKKHRLILLKVGAISASNLNAVNINADNISRLIIGQLNVNSLRDKFESVVQQVTGNIDILMVLEMKLENSLPVSQFLIEDYSLPFRLDRDNNGVNIMIFVREDIACKFLSVQNHPIKGFAEEFNLRKNKWLLCYSYNPIRCIIDFHIVNLNRGQLYIHHILKISLLQEILMWRQMIVLFQFLAIITT